MRSDNWLKGAENSLKQAGIGTTRLDALVLLEDECHKNRGWVLAHPEFELSTTQIAKLNKKVARRVEHEPLAYIRGFTEFYGRRFMVNKDVLEPRPESETMVDLLIEVANRLRVTGYRLRLVDVGTGSGALAIIAKLEFPDAEVIAIDNDPKCLVVARRNAKFHQVKVKFLQGDLLIPSRNLSTVTCNLVMANLPYVPNNWQINKAAQWEPKSAIYGGPDGLDVYRRLFEQINSSKYKPSAILTESMPPQQPKLARIASKSGYRLAKSADFIQLFQPDPY